MIQKAIELLVMGKQLSDDVCRDVAREIISGNTNDLQVASFLTAFRMKGETVEEIASFARVMREFCKEINPKVDGALVDTCGTGGDSIKTFNISTASAFVLAGAGIPIAKHGNRSVTSKCGSADVLEALDVNMGLTPEQVETTIEKIGIGFMFAPTFHPTMKNVQNVRKELGIRTVFNLLGPLTNPANAKAQVIGVYSEKGVLKIAQVLKELGCKRGLVVHGSGMDEISTIGPTNVAELKDGEITEYFVSPEDFGITKATRNDLYAKDIKTAVRFTREVLEGKSGPRLDIVLLNAAAGIMVSGLAETLEDGLEIARESVRSGKAREKLEELVAETQKYEVGKEKLELGKVVGPIVNKKRKVKIIAEVKPASPSSGKLRDVDVAQTVKEFEKGKVSAISVLVEKEKFGGSIDLLKEVRKHTKLPILAKGFFFEPEHIREVALAGADMFLLMVRVVKAEGKDLAELIRYGRSLNMEPVVEVHTAEELETAIGSGAKIIEINNRNIYDDLSIDFENSALGKDLPDELVFISASGVDTKSDIEKIQAISGNRVDAILIGSTLMRSKNISNKLKSLGDPDA